VNVKFTSINPFFNKAKHGSARLTIPRIQGKDHSSQPGPLESHIVGWGKPGNAVTPYVNYVNPWLEKGNLSSYHQKPLNPI
jgi:hypothetical protein